MAVDLSTLSIEELQALSYQASAEAAQRRAEEEQAELEEQADRNQRISNAVSRLTNLLGPADSPLYIPGGAIPATIRSLVKHTPANLAANSGIALQLILQGMEELTVTTRDIATLMAE